MDRQRGEGDRPVSESLDIMDRRKDEERGLRDQVAASDAYRAHAAEQDTPARRQERDR